ncbi:L-seryl-tRNA(Sec) selenium transferase [Salipaludibacillus sp. CUR1]|uniref:L-seryl-tRNA(Sec) selenium transferase n=1 Tax=Salipaludibacillus sp. CUR1 TaxID=2820003 RepID=UPI001E368FFB|nr:L-seryl-tRNA(Sec) selenium transferase [Salipaludibacillus sp. CUR1]MCE7791226.1 L-seryl-tRNA(Sec) selenium transferase [Salipaludibacillus sp. CUR1]
MNPYQLLPPVHEVLASSEAQELIDIWKVPEKLFKDWLQEEVDYERELIAEKKTSNDSLTRPQLTSQILERLTRRCRDFSPYNLRHVVNATGTVLHTNLGRARLSERAAAQVVKSATHYSNLEYDLESGRRGSRHSIIQDLLAKASGAEAAMVVNNNAAAVYFILRAFAEGAEVIVSRGELVEIGGSFRVSTIMEESGAKLVEVGTTNKTHPSDYEEALSDKTAMVMKVHTSNFKTVGFTEEVPVKELKEIVSSSSLEEAPIVYEDLGSGSLYPFKNKGIGDEPLVKQALKDGADLISFSGDKLLGGPQAGVIAGRKTLIDKLKKHPLARVLRVDKMTLAALEATLFDYVYRENELNDNPTVRDILKSREQIRETAQYTFNELQGSLRSVSLSVEEETSKVGGGTMPLEELPTCGIALTKEGMSANACERFFRKGDIPVICRVTEDRLFIDFRTLDEEDLLVVKNKILALDNVNGEG